MPRLPVPAAALLCLTSAVAAEPLVIADFESPDYGAWQAAGSAFGSGPAQGRLEHQQEVTGFRGGGFANSYHGGDNAVGTLTSPPVRLERKYISFLIGGGGWHGETCLNLVVGGKTVRSATGPNRAPGGSETLTPGGWDVTEFAGREATFVIVDQKTSGWGHINVDDIIQTDTPPPAAAAPVSRTLRIDADFLQFPLMQRESNDNSRAQKFTIESGGEVLRFMRLEIAGPEQTPDFWFSADVREFRDREVAFHYTSTDPAVLDRLAMSDVEQIDPEAYHGPNRPLYHFSPRLGWMNDVNGSYYQHGLYHLFYQANPTTTAWSTGFDMHWGHSVSKDLVHWEEWPIALFPDHTGDCFSGTALRIDRHIPGVNDGLPLPTPALMFAGTTPFSQHLAVSGDGGRTWQRHAGNPVVPNRGDGDRDPKVIWHEATQHYVMILFVGGKGYVILRSPDLTTWEETSVLPGWFECPEFFPYKSPVTGEELWALYGSYNSPEDAVEKISGPSVWQPGKFDGKTFTAAGAPRTAHFGPAFYAALTFVNAPAGRQIMMGWARGTRFPGEPFNQCATLPLELQIRAVNGEDTLCFEPVAEVEALRGEALVSLNNVSTADASGPLAALPADAAVDITLTFPGGSGSPLRCTFRTCEFLYTPATGELSLTQNGKPAGSTTLHPDGPLTARFLIDRGIVECFWNNGESAWTIPLLHTEAGPLFQVAGDTSIRTLTVYPVKGIWKR